MSDPTALLAGMAEPGKAENLSPPKALPTVLRIRENNPGMFTGPGTNTFVVGDEKLWLIDPGEDRDDGHREAILAAIGDRRVQGILITHAHGDHWPLGTRLGQELQVPTYGFDPARLEHPSEKFTPDEVLEDGQRLEGDSFALECLHTPGHCGDHLSFALRDGAEARPQKANIGPILFCGDHVMAWSSTILAPPDGSLNQYLSSLEKLIALAPSCLYPAHGPQIDTAQARMEELRDHRLARTEQLLKALEPGPLTLHEAVAIIYVDTDPKLHGAAAASLQAHVDALREDGAISTSGELIRLS